MNWILSMFTLLIGLNAVAFGPMAEIPNGTYKGTEVCNGTKYPTVMTFTDNTLNWDGQLDEFDFGPVTNGFFNLKSISGATGSGQGHFTSNGLHYEVTYSFVEGDGSTYPAPGEDTLTYTQGVIHLDASASAGSKGKILCTGEFLITP